MHKFFNRFDTSILMWFFGHHVDIYQVTGDALTPETLMPASDPRILMHYDFTFPPLLFILAVSSFSCSETECD